ECDGVRDGGLNAALADLLGVAVEEFCPLRAEETARIDTTAGEVLDVQVWTEDLAVLDAEVQATYADGPVPGGAAITRASRGSGHAWYLASDLSIDGLSGVFAEVYPRAGSAASDLPTDVEPVERAAAAWPARQFAVKDTA